MCNNLDNDKREQVKETDKRKKEIRDNIDGNTKGELKYVDNKRKKEKRDNLETHEKELLKIMKKKGERKLHYNVDDAKREKLDTMVKTEKRKENKCVAFKDERKKFFDNVRRCNMVDLFVLTTPTFKVIEEDFKSVIQEGPTYICHRCWKFEFRKNFFKLNALKYQTGICHKLSTGK